MGTAALSPGKKLQGRKPNHSTPSSVEVKNGGAKFPLPNTSSCHDASLIKHRDKKMMKNDTVLEL
jgi:hypothetical protein